MGVSRRAKPTECHWDTLEVLKKSCRYDLTLSRLNKDGIPLTKWITGCSREVYLLELIS